MASSENIWKVKVFKLNLAGDWIDKGVGYLEIEHKTVSVFSEENPSSTILTYTIKSEDYCKQSDTILTWQSEDNEKLALSFTDDLSISTFLSELCRIQGKSPTDITAEEDFDESPVIPVPNLTNLPEILYKISFGYSNQLADQLIELDFVKKIREIFESLLADNLDNLNLIFLIYKELFQLGNREILETLLSDEEFSSMIKALRYDPALSKGFDMWEIFEGCKFVDLLGVDKEVKAMVERVNRVVFVKETALVRVLNDKANVFLQLYLQSQFKEILNYFILNKDSCESLQQKLKSKDPQAFKFFRELLNTSKLVPISDRQVFFFTLIKNNYASLLQNFFDTDKKEEAVEVLSDFLNTVIDICPDALKSVFFPENSPIHSEFFVILVKLMLKSNSIGTIQEVCKFIKSFLIPDTPVFDILANIFYSEISPIFIKEIKVLSDEVLIEISSIYCFCIEKHSNFIVDCICSTKIVCELMILSETRPHLKLQVLKLISSAVQKKNKSLDVFIVQNKVVDYVFSLLQLNAASQNLIFSVALNTIEKFQHSSTLVLNYLKNKYFTSLKKLGLDRLCIKFEEEYIRGMAADSL